MKTYLRICLAVFRILASVVGVEPEPDVESTTLPSQTTSQNPPSQTTSSENLPGTAPMVWNHAWTPLDILPAVCKNVPALITMNVTDFAPDQYKPTIVTLMRTSGKAVTMSISATDGAGATVIEKTQISLADISSMGGRRLVEAATTKKEELDFPLKEADLLENEDTDDAWELEDEDLQEIDDEDDVDKDESLRPRLKARQYEKGRLLRKGGFRSSGSRSRPSSSRSRPSPPPPPPPPKYKSSDPRSYGDARRRANPVTARRRDAPAPTGLRRRVNSIDGKRYDNPSNPSAGSYGYTNQQKLNSNFPAGKQSTSYGYSGGNVHRSSSTGKIAMAAAAGGAVGLGVGYLMMSRWHRGGWGWRGKQCDGDGGWSGDCKDCFRQYDSCQLKVDRDAGRDDLMNTGFIPFGYTDPIVFRVEDITGDDYVAANICPPDGWSPDSNAVQWDNQPTFQDIWMTFTSLDELEETLQNDATTAASCAMLSFPFYTFVGIRILIGLARMS